MSKPLRQVAAEAAGLAVLLAVGAWLLSGSLDTAANYDEGVYLASLDALRHGQELGKDVFSDQPPGFYVLLQGLAAVFGNSVHGVRVGMLVVALVGVVAAWACGRAFGGPAAGLGAAALLVIAPAFVSIAPLVEADPPAVTFSLGSLAFAVWAFREPERPALAFLAGAAAVAAASMKLLAVTVLVPLAALVLRERPSRRALLLALAGGAAVVLAFVGAYAGSLGEIWTGIVTVHRHARTIEAPGYASNAGRVLHFGDRTPFVVLALAGIVAFALRRRETWPLWTWTVAAGAFLVWQRPLLDHHLILLAGALALPAGAALGGAAVRMPRPLVLAAGAIAAAAVAAGAVQQHRQVARSVRAEPPEVEWAVRELRAITRPGQPIATDLPIVAYRARRQIPGQLIDTSVGRLGSGFLRPREVLRLVDRDGVRAVVAARLFHDYPEIERGLRARFPRRLARGTVTIYLRRSAP